MNISMQNSGGKLEIRGLTIVDAIAASPPDRKLRMLIKTTVLIP
jgi:hypothetical protein